MKYIGCGVKMKKMIYVDNSATTAVSEKALSAMLPCFCENYGNPSSIHGRGQDARKVLEDSRRTVASAIGAYNNEIYFTSGGTECDNWAINAVCELKRDKGSHIISTAIEHNAVLKTLEKLQKYGFEITLLKPDKYGQITAEQLKQNIRSDTILVSIMMANNVVGTILPIKELCDAAHENGILFHSDAVQAVSHVPINVRNLGVDLLSMSAHKFHGPKGVGALFSKLPLLPPPFLTGGGQEKGGRSGTENIPGIAGMAAAIKEGIDHLPENTEKIRANRDKLIERVLEIPGAYLTGDAVNRLPGLASFIFEGIEQSAFVINKLNESGICASSGSACSASSKEAPHVLLAMGYDEKMSHGTLRISLSEYNTEEEIDVIIDRLPVIIAEIRSQNEKGNNFI
jgi:cysteine desulfurase